MTEVKAKLVLRKNILLSVLSSKVLHVSQCF